MPTIFIMFTKMVIKVCHFRHHENHNEIDKSYEISSFAPSSRNAVKLIMTYYRTIVSAITAIILDL